MGRLPKKKLRSPTPLKAWFDAHPLIHTAELLINRAASVGVVLAASTVSNHASGKTHPQQEARELYEHLTAGDVRAEDWFD